MMILRNHIWRIRTVYTHRVHLRAHNYGFTEVHLHFVCVQKDMWISNISTICIYRYVYRIYTLCTLVCIQTHTSPNLTPFNTTGPVPRGVWCHVPCLPRFVSWSAPSQQSALGNLSSQGDCIMRQHLPSRSLWSQIPMSTAPCLALNGYPGIAGNIHHQPR